MSKKSSLLSLFFGLTLLFAMALQAMDSLHHLEETFAEKKCLHLSSGNQAEIIHGHAESDHCFVCEFTFGNAVTNDFFSFLSKNSTVLTSYTFFHSREITQFFKGSLFALRAPPVFIV